MNRPRMYVVDKRRSRLPTTCNFCGKDITDIPYYSIRNPNRLYRQYHIGCYPADSRPKTEASSQIIFLGT